MRLSQRLSAIFSGRIALAGKGAGAAPAPEGERGAERLVPATDGYHRRGTAACQCPGWDRKRR